MDMIKVKINGREYAVEKGATVLEAAKAAHIDIPTLCYLKDINEIGACRLCLVEVSERRGPAMGPFRMVTACVYPCTDGMEIKTNTPRIAESRRMNLELLLSNHEKKCLSCVRSTNCELQTLCREYGVDASRFEGVVNHYEVDAKSPIIRDNNKCILCRRCVATCAKVQGIGVIGANNRGFDTYIGSAFGEALADTSCINCGQCIVTCPVGALYERDDTDEVFEALADPDKHVLICAAPSVRAQIGECFGYEPGTDTEGKMVAALNALGFDGVFDMNLTADLTIVEGTTEDVINAINQFVKEDQANGLQAGIIATEETISKYPFGTVKCIGSREAEETIAHNLYEVLREFDQCQVSKIYSEAFYTPKMGQAIMNRLLKAAGHKIIQVGREEK